MGERLLCKQEVVGSIPSGSTTSGLERGAPKALLVRRENNSAPGIEGFDTGCAISDIVKW